MSKLAALVRATPLKEIKYSDSRLTKVSSDDSLISTSYGFGQMRAFKIAVEVGAKCFIDEYKSKSNGEDINERIAAMRRAVVEEVFGEFRAPLYEVTGALYDCDFRKARALLSLLERKMYSEEA